MQRMEAPQRTNEILSEVQKQSFLGFGDGLETVGDKRLGKGFGNGLWEQLRSRGYFGGSKFGARVTRHVKGKL